MRAVTILAAMAGCAKVPVYMPPANLDPLVTVNDASSVDVAVHAQGYDLQFGRDKSVRLPVQFLVNGVNLLGTGSCPSEDRVGIGLDPLAIASSSVAVRSEDSILNVMEAGPVVVLVGVTYKVPYSCQNAAGGAVVQYLVGESQFTMTANRITRRDLAVTPSTDMVATDRVCDLCNVGMRTPDAFDFTSYWRFATGSTFRDRNDQALALGAQASNATCVTTANQRLAVVWQAQQTMVPELKQDVVAYRWLSEQEQQMTLLPEPKSAISNIAVGAGSCGELIDDATDETLLFNGDELEPDEDGIYRFNQTDNIVEIRAADAPLEHAFAVEIPIELDSIRHFHLTRDGTDVTDFQLQQLGSSGTMVWMYAGIGRGESVTIEFD